MYSTTAADVLASLLLDLKKVNVESSIFITEFENLLLAAYMLVVFFFSLALKQKCYIQCAQCWWYFSFLQRLSKNVRYSVHNVNAYVNTLSFSIKLLLGENTFFMEYLRATASSRYPPEKLFRKFFKNSPKNTLEACRKSFFNDVADSIPETLHKRNLNQYVFLQILSIFQNKVSLKDFVRLPLDEVYLFCKNASPKYVQNFPKDM